jgi:titin
LIELSGASAGLGAAGLIVTVGNCTVEGLDINQFSADAIDLSTNGGNTIQANYIGVDPTGTVALGNAGDGADLINAGTGNTIGGTVAGAGNVIAGDTRVGIWVSSSSSELIAGNFIGVNAGGTGALGNGLTSDLPGLLITAGSNNVTIGGTTTAARNVISGNYEGIELQGNSALVQGNLIGTNAAGTAVLPNLTNGVLINSAASLNTIGGSSSVNPSTGDLSGAGNVISGNLNSGVQINSGTSNFIQGNFIGTDITGEIALGNDPTGLYDGIDIFAGSNNTIGGASSLDAHGNLSRLGNLISGNFGSTSSNGDERVRRGSWCSPAWAPAKIILRATSRLRPRCRAL